MMVPFMTNTTPEGSSNGAVLAPIGTKTANFFGSEPRQLVAASDTVQSIPLIGTALTPALHPVEALLNVAVRTKLTRTT